MTGSTTRASRPASRSPGPTGTSDPAGDCGEAAPLLKVRGLTRRFGGLVALEEIDLDVEVGRLLVVMGPNGAGKSTLVDLLTGYLRPNEGGFRLDGVDLTFSPRWSLARSGITRTFQVPRPLARFDVRENVRIAARCGSPPRPGRSAAERQAAELLSETGLDGQASCYPAELSLASLRRLELARALAGRPRLLIADEPLGGLAGADIDAGIALLRTLARPDRGVIVIEHAVRAVLQVADELAFLHHGRLLRRGPAAEVLADRAVVDAYVGAGLLRRGLL